MLASITPLGERGRHSRWAITVSAFLLAATAAAAGLGALAGAVAGALAAALGALTAASSVSPAGRLAVVGVAGLVAAVLDARGDRVPGPRRQVNEDWLVAFRGWVYGLGYGAQLGLGITTVVSSAALYVALVAAVTTGDPVRGAVVVGCFGAARGATLLSAARVRRPEQLRALHARLRRWRRPARGGAIAVLGAIAAAAVIGALA